VITLDYSPRVRVEWFLAAARVGLASAALVAVSFDAPTLLAHSLITVYLLFSLCVLGLVWAPVRFSPGWGVGLHVIDIMSFSALMVVTNGASSSYFMTLIYLLVGGTIRWQAPGTYGTALAATVAFVAASAFGPALGFGGSPVISGGTLIVRVIYMMMAAALLGHLGAHQRRYRTEISRLAAWPRTMSREPYAVVSEIISQAVDLLHAPRIVVAWSDADEASLNIAWIENGQVIWKEEGHDIYGSLVSPMLIGRTFQTDDATLERSRVVVLARSRFLRRRGRPINERLRAQFEMRAVQSWPLDGELVRGRMFCLDKPTQQLDDLEMGEFVARLATSRLDGLYLLSRLQDARALEERVRVARDLHDSFLQSQAGAALQLLAARRLLERDPSAGKQRLDEVQHQLEHGELEMRAFIRDLRPTRRVTLDIAPIGLRERLQQQARRLEQQWNLSVSLAIDEAVDQMNGRVTAEVYRLVYEGLVNAARHAEASTIRVHLSIADGRVHLSIADNGKGFPFTGTYDLAWLEQMDEGPVTLRERVAAMQGNLTLTSSRQTGTELLITVPLVTA
jgi:signal transduction histidine kinase